MALATYTVKRGDSLWKIASGGCGKNVSSSISGSTTNAKINTLVKLNDIKNKNLIYVGQVLKLSGSSKTSSSSTSTKSNVPVITAFGLQSEDTTGRAMYTAWSFSKSNTEKFKVRWTYYADNLWQIGKEEETTSAESIYCNDTWSAPDNASKVKVRVQAISKTYKSGNTEKKYWSDVWSAEKTYDFSNNPPYPPDIPDVVIKDFTLTASIDNINAEKLCADSVEFEIIKNNASSLGAYAAKINTVSNYVSYVHTVEAGAEYKVRARCKRGDKVSGWTDFSSNVGTKPAIPSAITTCIAKTYDVNKTVSAYLEWTVVNNAETYDIEYATNKSFFDGSDGTTEVTGIKFNHHEITSLAIGTEYFFRVRAVNTNGESDWSEIKSVVLGTKPIAPTTWSSTTTAVVGEPLNLYWVHNAEDGSSQTFAELRLFVNDVHQAPDIVIENTTDPDEKDKTSVYAIDTTDYPVGTKLRWQVRTAGVTKDFGDWSIERVVDIYAKPTLALAVTTLPDGTGDIINTLTRFPFFIYALPGPNTQAPIGYQLKVTANEYYETIDDTGRTQMVNKGDAIYSKHFDINTPLIVEMSADNIDLEADIEYTITCSVTMNSGLSTETSHSFTVDWTDIEYDINADVTIDRETYTASIMPYCEDADGSLVDDITLSVYRREFDGSFKELAKDLPNTNSITVSDPHPSLDYARYRIVGKTKSTGAISYHDLPGVEVGGYAVIIQWNEDWSVFDAADEYSVEKPAWSGSMLKLPYNINVSDKYSVDTELVKYIGREHPVAYYGTQLGETSSWSMEIPKEDKDTLYAIRRLAKWTGTVYVREPSGSGYWASISVSYNQAHDSVTIPITLEITRVEGGI